MDVRNSGNLPAKHVKVSGKFKCGDEEVEYKCPTKGVVFPSDTIEKWLMGVVDVPKGEIMEGTKVLKVEMKAEYYGAGNDCFWTSKNGTYDVERNSLINVEDDCN